MRHLINIVESAQEGVVDYPELDGTRGNWAPYVVRKFTDDGVITYKVFQQARCVASAVLSRSGAYVTDLAVEPEHRRRGIASKLYDYIERDLGHKLVPSPTHQTDDGRAFWSKRLGK